MSVCVVVSLNAGGELPEGSYNKQRFFRGKSARNSVFAEGGRAGAFVA